MVRARAEDLHGAWTADAVTARAVAPLARLAGWCLPLVAPGGAMLALKGDRAAAELAASEQHLRQLGATSWSVEEHGAGLVDPPVRVVRIVRRTDPPRLATPALIAKRSRFRDRWWSTAVNSSRYACVDHGSVIISQEGGRRRSRSSGRRQPSLVPRMRVGECAR